MRAANGPQLQGQLIAEHDPRRRLGNTTRSVHGLPAADARIAQAHLERVGLAEQGGARAPPSAPQPRADSGADDLRHRHAHRRYSTPAGKLTFKLFGPDDANCSRAPAFTYNATVIGNGSYQSGSFTATLGRNLPVGGRLLGRRQQRRRRPDSVRRRHRDSRREPGHADPQLFGDRTRIAAAHARPARWSARDPQDA